MAPELRKPKVNTPMERVASDPRQEAECAQRSAHAEVDAFGEVAERIPAMAEGGESIRLFRNNAYRCTSTGFTPEE